MADTGIDAAQQVRSSRPPATSSILVQTEPLTPVESNTISTTIQQTVDVPKAAISIDEIGPSWGKEVAKRSLIGLVVFLILVVLLIWGYFRQWKMSVAAIVALAHDLLITIGIYALSGFEVTPATVTGVLTILGFSLYDTVVVFDKVRENTKNLRESQQTYAEAANLAVNQTLVRSINTSIVALHPGRRPPLRRRCAARQRAAEGPRARAVRRHGRRRLLLDLHRDAAAGAHEVEARPSIQEQEKRDQGASSPRRRPLRLGARRSARTCRSLRTPTRRRPRVSGGEPAGTPSGGNRPLPTTDAVGRGRVVPPSAWPGEAELRRPGGSSPPGRRSPNEARSDPTRHGRRRRAPAQAGRRRTGLPRAGRGVQGHHADARRPGRVRVR